MCWQVHVHSTVAPVANTVSRVELARARGYCIFSNKTNFFLRYGRKYTIMGTATALLIFGVSASFANSFALFIVLRYVIAFTGFGCITTAFVMCKFEEHL